MITPTLRTVASVMNEPVWGAYLGGLNHGPRVPELLVHPLRHKRWIYVGVYAPDMVFGAAVVSLGFATNVFAYIGSVDSRGVRTWSSVGAPWSADVTRSHARWGKSLQIALPTQTHHGHIRGSFRASETPVEIDLSLERMYTDRETAVTCIAPVDDRTHRWVLTTKDNTLTAQGTILWGTSQHTFAAPAISDITDGYPPRTTVWHWLSLAGKCTEGRTIGINLCALHNDSDRARENVLWVDGAAIALGQVKFSFDATRRDSAPWTIVGDGINLRFEPSGMRQGDENLLLVVSRFVQPFGRFFGTVTVNETTVRLDGVTGVVEDHYAMW
jgi:hypothetical protein